MNNIIFDFHDIEQIIEFHNIIEGRYKFDKIGRRNEYTAIVKILTNIDIALEPFKQEFKERGLECTHKELWRYIMIALDVYACTQKQEGTDEKTIQFAVDLISFYTAHIYDAVLRYKCDMELAWTELISTQNGFNTTDESEKNIITLSKLHSQFKKKAEANKALSFISEMNSNIRKFFANKGYLVFDNHYAYLKIGTAI